MPLVCVLTKIDKHKCKNWQAADNVLADVWCKLLISFILTIYDKDKAICDLWFMRNAVKFRRFWYLWFYFRLPLWLFLSKQLKRWIEACKLAAVYFSLSHCFFGYFYWTYTATSCIGTQFINFDTLMTYPDDFALKWRAIDLENRC